jgi:hypothetical protein
LREFPGRQEPGNFNLELLLFRNASLQAQYYGEGSRKRSFEWKRRAFLLGAS